ncbi:MAG TPA: glycoside hydrolase family 27 protein [Candidatus Acidoferrum sp.]|nr:glycoside hydrolase family 27 protein [Candidatus Acidoferrum sp.]
MKINSRTGSLFIGFVLFLGITAAFRPHVAVQEEEASSLEIVHAAAPPERIPAAPASALLAATPPLGWNSWDGYGTTINEEQVKANSKWFAEHLKPAGWQYVVVDMEWFVTNPTPEGNSKTSLYSLDANGRYTPALNRFPSAANQKGFKPLGDYVHSLGLKFGIHILRGIPKKAVEANLPIAGSSLHATDAADTSETCPWNPDNYGIDAAKSGAQPYYDSIFSLYASWGVDLVKVDCISSRPYRGDEIQLISNSIAKTGWPIALSLSPGPAPIEKIEEMRKYAQMWRVSNDVWDIWHSEVEYPQGLGDQFANAIRWGGLSQPGHWPDLDMLPLGNLGPAPGWGQPRITRLSRGEQRTLMTLWSIFPSPLMIGGDLTKADDWTLSLLTNREVLEVDQHSMTNHVAVASDKRAIWLAESSSEHSYYLAVFNRGEAKDEFRYSWKELGLSQNSYATRDLWGQKDLGIAKELLVTLQPHESVLYKLQPQAGKP